MPKLTKQQFNDLLADQQIVNDINQSLGQYGINIDIGVARDAENDDSPLKKSIFTMINDYLALKENERIIMSNYLKELQELEERMSIKPRRRRKRRLAPGQSTAAEQAIDEVESDWKTALTRIAELAKMQYQLLLNAREHFTESKQAVNQQRIDLAKEFTNASEEQIKEQFQKFDTATAPQQQIAAMGELGLTGANILHANRMHKILQGLDKAIAMVDKKLAEAEAFQARIQQLLAQNKVSADQVQQCEKQIIQLQKELEPLLGMASPSVTPAPSANTTPTPKPTPNRAKKQDEELAKEETKQETSTSRFAAKLKQLPTWIKEAVFNINSRKEEEEIAKATASPKMTGRR